MLPAPLRKAAILISTLDERAADALLEQMGPEQAARVRSALMELETIDPAEQEQILAEFLGRDAATSIPAAADSEEVELDLSAESQRAIATGAIAAGEAALPFPAGVFASETPFAFVQRIEPAVLARELAREHAQTIAAVLAHLSPSQAAAVLESLPTGLATDSLERMATIDQLTPEVLADLECELQQRLAPYLRAAAASVNSLQRLHCVLDAMDQRQRQRLAQHLSDRNTALASRLGLHDYAEAPPAAPVAAILQYRVESSRAPAPAGTPLEFSEIAELSDRSLRTLFAAASPAVVLLALTGAEPRLAERVLRCLPATDAAALRRGLKQPGPLRLRDIDAAQRELAALAGQLIHEGRIEPPSRARFAVAA